jgi:hypothetical protein
MTTPGSTPEQGLPGSAQAPSPAELRAKVAALADQVRALANGGHPALGDAPVMARTDPSRAPSSDELQGVSGDEPPRPREARVEPPRAQADDNAAAVEEFAYLSGRLLESVIDTAELAAAEIRASAEREAADIRGRADAAIGEADAALARYREALTALAVETERIELSIVALREQAETLEQERGRVDVAIEVLRRRPAR